MTLLAPLQLAAAAGVLVPILIHLLGRPRPRLVRFPWLRLLRVAHRERHSAVRVQRLLALIMRCLAVMLLALALALPVTRAWWLTPIGVPVGCTAVVIDTSASMRVGADAEPGIVVARRAARAILQALPVGEGVTLATASASLQPVGGRGVPVIDAELATSGIAATDQRGRLGQCLGQLAAHAPGPLTVLLLTDLQASSLAAPAPGTLPPGTVVVVVNVGALPAANVSVTDLRMPGGPILRTRPLPVEALLHAWGPQVPRNLPVRLLRGSTVEAAATATPAPGGAGIAELEMVPSRAGMFAAEVRLPGDAFWPDDRRVAAGLVRNRLRVVLCGTAELTRFLHAALDPFPPGDERSTVEVVPAMPVDLTPALLHGADAIVLAEPGSLGAEALRAIQEVARLGTGVLVFAGPQTDVEALNGRVLPALGLGGVRLGAPEQHEDGLAMAELATDRPPLDAFAEPSAGELPAARFTTIRDVEVAAEAVVSVLARLDDGTPALLEGAIGRGCVLLWPTAPDAAWSDLPRLAVWVPLVHRLAGHLAAGRMTTVLAGAPGEPAVCHAPDDAGAVRVEGPGGEDVPVEAAAGSLRFTPQRIGAYRVLAGAEEIAVCAVNLDPAESDPARLSVEELARRLQPAQVAVVAADRASEVVSRLARSSDISALFALLALVLLALDGALVHRSEGSGTG
ncbi:MAG: BatA domain-containing protein [Armatimonadota bacterium]